MASMTIIYNLLLRIEFPDINLFFKSFLFINQVRHFGSVVCFHLQAWKAPNMMYPLDRLSLECIMKGV
jgi:hypothetical protein